LSSRLAERSIWIADLAPANGANGGWARAGMLALFSAWHDHRDVRRIDPNSRQAQIIRLFDTTPGRDGRRRGATARISVGRGSGRRRRLRSGVPATWAPLRLHEALVA
jgi:hypothetical protein